MVEEEEFAYPYMVFPEGEIPKRDFNKWFEVVLERNTGKVVTSLDLATQMCAEGLGGFDLPPERFSSVIGKLLIKRGFKTGQSSHGRYYQIPKDYKTKKEGD